MTTLSSRLSGILCRSMVVLYFFLSFTKPPHAEERLALVIGNNDYPAALGRLELAVPDAERVAASLASVGFEVDLRLDADRDDMEAAIDRFLARLSESDGAIAFFYYSGHGVSTEIPGAGEVNLLVPAREILTDRTQIFRRSQRLDELITAISLTNARAAFVVSDACREDFALSDTRGRSKGFSPEPQRPGMLVAYATAAGGLAPDDGVFASALSEQITRPGQDASVAFVRTLQAVARERNLNEMPFMAPGYIPEDICFAGCQTSVAPAPADSQPRIMIVPAEANPDTDPHRFRTQQTTGPHWEAVYQKATVMRPSRLLSAPTSSETIALVQRGMSVTLLERDTQSRWVRVRTIDGDEGYALDQGTFELITQTSEASGWQEVNEPVLVLENLRVRARQSQFGNTITTLNVGDIATVVARSSDSRWVRIRDSVGREGYILDTGQLRAL